MSELERVKKVINWLKYKGMADTDSILAKKLGYTKSSLSQILNERVPLSNRFIDRLVSLDENINKVWINTGTGEMLRKDSTTNIKTKINQEMYERLLEEKDKRIQHLEAQVAKCHEVIDSLMGRSANSNKQTGS